MMLLSIAQIKISAMYFLKCGRENHDTARNEAGKTKQPLTEHKTKTKQFYMYCLKINTMNREIKTKQNCCLYPKCLLFQT